MKKKSGRPSKGPTGSGSSGNGNTGSSADAQRQRSLAGLQEATAAGLNTIELREHYDVMMPAARVHELRWMFGHNILTVWETATNAQGNIHRVARYVLAPGKWRGAA